MSDILTKDGILNSKDLVTEKVEISEWRGHVFVRTLLSEEKDQFEVGTLVDPGNSEEVRLDNMRARLVALVVVDAEGERIFSDEDAPALGKKSASAVDKVYSVASRLNAIDKKDEKELTKN